MSRRYWDQWQSFIREEEPGTDVSFLKRLLQRGLPTVLDVGSGRSVLTIEFRPKKTWNITRVQMIKQGG